MSLPMPRFDELLVMPDERFFHLLDLEQAPLQTVRHAVSGNDFETARTALVDYYRNLDDTPFGPFPSIEENHPPQTTPDGERALEHWVSVWGREVRLPADIPWLRPDASHPYRGDYPPWNDSGGNRDETDPLPDEMGWLVELGADFTGRDDLRYVNTRGREGSPPEHTSHHFPYAGFFVMRSDWTSRARFLMFDGGRNLGGYQHPHMDQLSFVLAACGHTLITDTGYGGPWIGRWRQEYYAATPGHNAIAVDDQWQAQYPEENPAANQRWNARPMIGNLWSVSPGLVTRGIASGPLPGNRWISTSQFDYARSTYDQGFTRDPHSLPEERLQVVHERRILFLKPDYWIVTDFLTGTGQHEYEAYFHFPAAARTDVTTNEISVRHLEAQLRILPLCAQPFTIRIAAGQREPIQGWLPGDWGEHVPAPTAIISGKIHLPLTLHTVLFPTPADCTPQINAGFLGQDDSAIEVTVNGRRDIYLASQDPEREHRIDKWTFTGESAAIRLDQRGRIHAQFGNIGIY